MTAVKGFEVSDEWKRIGYTKLVLDHFRNPRNVGVIENPTVSVRVGSVACGDMIKIYMVIEDDIIKDVKYQSYGCAANIATASITSELIKGKHVDQVKDFKFDDIVKALGGLPRTKYHCAVLADQAVKACIAKYEVMKGRRELSEGLIRLLLSGVIDPMTGGGAMYENVLRIVEFDKERKKLVLEIDGNPEDEADKDIEDQAREALSGLSVSLEFRYTGRNRKGEFKIE
ncbi:MAG: iron-sulfur cluster assembly scaffold protein [Euryarchaeota archaeon]|nr:iron-sulfur cluster assembly scaffold protein [Euryarchaeota archaeon]